MGDRCWEVRGRSEKGDVTVREGQAVRGCEWGTGVGGSEWWYREAVRGLAGGGGVVVSGLTWGGVRVDKEVPR
jgi:hypothetical protein